MSSVCFRATALCLAATLTSGCATVINHTKQKVSIDSAPAGATVLVDGAKEGITPIVAKLKRKQNHIVRIELNGYEPYQVALTRDVSGWLFGNILIGGLIGVAIDAIDGAMYKLTPDQITAELKANAVAGRMPSLQADGLYIAVVLRPKSSWQKIGELKRLSNT